MTQYPYFWVSGKQGRFTGLPKCFSAEVWAELPDGQRLDVESFRGQAQSDTELTVTMPVHPSGIQRGGTVTFHFGGPEPIGTLTAELAAVLEIDNALPRLLKLTTGLLTDDLQDEGVSPELLVSQFRQSPNLVDPEYGFHA